jgi:hypothetical protein
VEDVRRWLGLERTETVANEQAEKISPATSKTSRVRPNIKLNVPPPRHSRGIGI